MQKLILVLIVAGSKTCQDGVGDSEIELINFRKVMFYGVQRNGVLIFLLICQP